MAGDEEGCIRLRARFLKQIDGVGGVFGIEGGGGFVGEDDRWSGRDRSGDRHPLLLADAQPVDPRSGRADAESFEELVGPRPLLAGTDAGEEHRKFDVLAGGQSGDEVVGLEDHPDPLGPDLIPSGAPKIADLLAVDSDRTPIRIELARGEHEEGALAAPRRALKEGSITPVELESIDAQREAAASAELELGDLQGGWHSGMLRREVTSWRPSCSQSGEQTDQRMMSEPTETSSEPVQRKGIWMFLRGYVGGRYSWVMFALFLMLLIGPLVGRIEIFSLGFYLGDALMLGLLILAAWSFSDSPRPFVICLSLAGGGILLGILGRMLPEEVGLGPSMAGQALIGIMLIYLIFLIATDIFVRDEVDTDTICGSIAVYLLIGGVFAVVYTMIFQFDPTAFYIPTRIETADPSLGPDHLMAYFSVTTLTTLGYGDIAPTAELARSLANLEALVGQVYLTVLVARLVGRHLYNARKHSKA